MTWRPDVPYNALPALPPLGLELEPKPVLKATIEARAALTTVAQAGLRLPNPEVLISAVPLLEAQASSEIENIVTTADELFKHAQVGGGDHATKEALRYRSALFAGLDDIRDRPLTAATASHICSVLHGREMTVRALPGTRIGNPTTGMVLYSPPEGRDLLLQKLGEWECFIHREDDLDPLVRMALAHYQFEAIHPFHDGNGRTGRVLNILILIEAGLLEAPILYLSRAIIARKNDYYRLLRAVTRSRALVSGYGLDLGATLLLVLIAAALLALAVVADERRDYDAPLWRRPIATSAEPGGQVARVMLGSVPTATMRRGAVGLLVWAVAAGTLIAMMGALQPSIIDVWSDLGFLSVFGEGGAEAGYWSFVSSMLPVVLAAYVITQTSTWVHDLQQGRVEMLRSTPISWTGLVLGRLIALLVGSAVITLVALGTLTSVAASVGSPLDAAGAARVALISVLFAAALGSLAALVTAVVRSSDVVIALGLVVGASYLLSYLVPLFGWPDWLNRLSLFWAFGTPYVGWPGVARLATLVVVTVGGTVGAAVAAERSASVP